MKRWSQLKKSWYVFFFQLPWLPEWWLGRNIRHLLKEDGVADDFIHDFASALHPRPAIDWYRASFRDGVRKRLAVKKVEHPALVVWGEAERHLERDLSVPPPEWVQDAHIEYVQNASHWVHHDAPDRVTELILSHFQRDLDEQSK
jgi:pimeloyl-ACP methyl ester carboxylesterase